MSSAISRELGLICLRAFAVGLLLLATALPVPGAIANADPSQRIDFNFHIRPLLSDRCFKCHGPDEKSRKAKLRLDTAEGARAIVDVSRGARAVYPGRPLDSEVYQRITTDDPDDLMPPPGSGLALTIQEKELIRRWIEEGAEYKSHWAFLPVVRPATPQVEKGLDFGNPVDAFVRARLAKEGLQLAPEASRELLLRRLSFDLTGLPPTLQELDAFLRDDAPGAYEKVVDRLLASPRYGERRAGEWLDLARYADTYGYQADVEHDLSPWRDWVIRAFNQNLPYDQFVVWQLAGDLLPNPSREQTLATAFNRLHRQTNEGGSIEEEFRTEYAADRVHTAGTAFLGLTLECARCHDHKFDPIRQRDYYRLFAFFNNIDESGLYSHFTMATPTPTLLLYREGEEDAHHELKQKIVAAETRLRRVASDEQNAFRTWMASNRAAVPLPQPAAEYRFENVQEGKTPSGPTTNNPALLVDAPSPVPGKHGQALRFSGDNSVVCKGVGEFGRTSSFSFSLWLWPAERQERAVLFHRSRAWTDSGSRGYELLLENGEPSFSLVHFWPGNALKVRVPEPLPTNQWTHLAVTYDGSSRANGVRIYINGQSSSVKVERDSLSKDIFHRRQWGDSDVGNIHLTLSGRFRDSGFRNGAIDEFLVFHRCLTPPEIRQLSQSAQGPEDEASLFDFYLATSSSAYRDALQEVQSLRQAENDFVNDIREIMVMREMSERRPTYVLKRGAYDAPGERVEPGVPDSLMPFSADLPRNRLGLAQWVVDRQNPLTARVAVNRVWRTHFGRGLVATAEDFGSQGQLPTHPELLDWLAAEFMESGWNLKSLHKRIVTSATYRQSSIAPPDLVARDPENRLLARGPKHRLQAEQIRDNALAISGLLSPRIGGPSVRPYQPAGLWEESGTGKRYIQDKGEKLYRRSLYTFWRRTAPPPTMLSFDATTREVCTAKRETTATPLQALILLNDPQFLESARVLAQQLVQDAPDDVNGRIAWAFRLATSREPDAREQAILLRMYNEQLAWFDEDHEAAARFISVGEHPHDPALPLPELAATALVASAVMNLDEFIMKR